MMKTKAAVCAACIALVLSSCGNPFLSKMFGEKKGEAETGGGTSGGFPDGSASHPWLIGSPADLAAIGTGSYGLGDHYELTGNVSLTGNWTPIGSSPGFTGTFDGNGKTITLGGTITPSTGGSFTYVGLFGNNNGVIQNLKVSGAITYTTGTSAVYAGGIAGSCSGTGVLIENCVSAAAVTIETSGSDCRVGGIAGSAGGNIKNCYSTGNVSGKSTGGTAHVGGLTGRAVYVTNCYATGTVSAEGASGIYAGGIDGRGNTTTTLLSSCVALNTSVTTTGGASNAGRVSGSLVGSAANCYANKAMQVNDSTVTTGTLTNKDGADVTLHLDGASSRAYSYRRGDTMYAAYHLNADELTADSIQTLKNVFHQRDIVILPKDEYAEMEKARHNEAYTRKLQDSMREFEEGKFVVKTMAELEAMARP